MTIITAKHLHANNRKSEQEYNWRLFKNTKFETADAKAHVGDVAMVVSRRADGKSYVSPVIITAISQATDPSKTYNVVLSVKAR